MFGICDKHFRVYHGTSPLVGLWLIRPNSNPPDNSRNVVFMSGCDQLGKDNFPIYKVTLLKQKR